MGHLIWEHGKGEKEKCIGAKHGARSLFNIMGIRRGRYECHLHLALGVYDEVWRGYTQVERPGMELYR